jgi:uncharacterized cupin superfamily protein
MITNAGEEVLRAGDCVCFAKNSADGHHFINKGRDMATYLEVGSRHEGDVCEYPDIDMRLVGGRFERKDGTPYLE